MGTLVNVLQPELRNLIINGNFDFWQRGTSISLANNTNTYQADRYLAYRFGFNAPTYAQSTDVPTYAQSGFKSRYSMLFTAGTGIAANSGDILQVGQRIEGQDLQAFHGKQIRIQFLVKSSITGTYAVTLQSANNPLRSYVAPYTVASASVWQKISLDILMDTASDASYNFDNTLGMSIAWVLSAGTTLQTASPNTWLSGDFRGSTSQVNWAGTTGATFQLAQVALYPVTAGPGTDLPFARAGRSVGHELQLCQRYYEKSFPQSSRPGIDIWGNNTQVTSYNSAVGINQTSTLPFKIIKRASPTMTIYNVTSTANTIYWLNTATNANGANKGNVYNVDEVGHGVSTGAASSGNASWGIAAWDWTADAEL